MIIYPDASLCQVQALIGIKARGICRFICWTMLLEEIASFENSKDGMFGEMILTDVAMKGYQNPKVLPTTQLALCGFVIWHGTG